MTSSSTSPNLTQDLAADSDQKLIDKQMAGVVEAIMIQSYSLANRGFIPSDAQIAAYIASLDEATLLQKVRRHPGAASTRALSASDDELLRWARLVGQRQYKGSRAR
ncbi:hypothetical protein [Pelomonas sp. KK5]|uniref:hypothetical protein n=1 Tax=Pelomonas sp. KK5 TaxID=1855730 RepID=UPI00097C230D|nr:hypothetical protein [Pelomonas sp. KK5]